jgi:hypothetical protein
MKVFKDITKDLDGKSRGNMTSPADKARGALKDLTKILMQLFLKHIYYIVNY